MKEQTDNRKIPERSSSFEEVKIDVIEFDKEDVMITSGEGYNNEDDLGDIDVNG